VVAVPPVRGVIANQVGGAADELSTVKGVPRFEVEPTLTATAGPGAYVVLPPEITVLMQVTVTLEETERPEPLLVVTALMVPLPEASFVPLALKVTSVTPEPAVTFAQPAAEMFTE
jgi:hypothetical protein